LKGSETSRAVLAAKGKRRRRLADFSDAASAECVKAAEDTTKELVEACLEPPNEERVSSVSTVGVVRSDVVLTFTQDVTIIESEVAGSFNNLTACIDEIVVDGNATVTLRRNAEENECFELEDGTVEDLTLTEEADTPTSTPSISGKSSDVSSSPTSTPTSQGESSDVSSAPAGAPSKSGKSSSAVPGVTKASKKSEASLKSSKSVKSAKAELPQESAERDEVEELEESVKHVEVDEPKESVKLDVEEEEETVEVTEDEEVEAEEEGLLYVLAKMLGGWW